MGRDRDLLDTILHWIVAPFAARFYRRRIERDSSVYEWQQGNPGLCMYCSYTKWANEEHGQSLTIEPHRCAEGNSPPHPLPKATVRS